MISGITAIVVTYNRKELLRNCLESLMNQTHKPDRILIVDNASTDGTRQFLASAGWLDSDGIELLALSENTGGAGGFAAGIKHALETGTDWVWIMDDDALPHPDALEKMTNNPLDPGNLYGSVAVWGNQLSWPLTTLAGHVVPAHEHSTLPEMIPVGFIPFLGTLISRPLVERIGLPDAGFFIAKDDVEYSCRARRAGALPILVTASLIEHPPAAYHRLNLLGYEFKTLQIPSWKRYYSVRNRILIARRYFGAALYYATLPGSLLHLTMALLFEPDRLNQLRAYVAGTVDGLRGRLGRRHSLWGL